MGLSCFLWTRKDRRMALCGIFQTQSLHCWELSVGMCPFIGHLTGSIQKRDILRLTVLCECIRAHVSVHSRLAFNIGCLPWLLSALFPLRQDLLLSLELADSARLTASSQHWNHRPALLYQLVHGEWESELRFLCLYGQWSHLPNPKADSSKSDIHLQDYMGAIKNPDA